MKTKLNQQGFNAAVGLVLILVLAGVAYAGWRVMSQNPSSGNDNAAPASQEINNASDLENAEKTLNDTNLDDLDTSELEAAEEELQ